MIDYRKIGQAVQRYQDLGYLNIEVPWLISRQAASFTAPEGIRQFETFAGCLPASGEQSFIHMYRLGQLRPGRFVTVTPCFRDEPVLDTWHKQHFLKVETIRIFDILPSDETVHKEILFAVGCAQLVMKELGVETTPVQVSPTQYDLISPTKIELGSYGYRYLGGIPWVYGTGLAEPRFSRCLEQLNTVEY